MLPILQIGPLAIQTPGLLVLAGVWLATWLLDKEARRLGLPTAALSNMVFLGLVSGVIGARLWYALRFIDVYLQNPLGLISLNPTTLAPLEGALTGILAAILYANRKRLPFWGTLDAVTPGLAALAIALGFSRLASGDGFGTPSAVPWAIDLWGAMRHPSQIYELIAAGLIFWSVWEMRRYKLLPGFLTLLFVALSSIGRLFLEAFRGDSLIVLGSLRSAQLISLGLLLASMLLLHYRATNQPQRS